MTLPRSNREGGHAVIDRNDDSSRVSVAAIWRRQIQTEVLLEALRHAGIDAWLVDHATTEPPTDQLRRRNASVVLLDLTAGGYTAGTRQLISRLARERLLAIVLDRDAAPGPGERSVQAGALWAVHPELCEIEDLALVVRLAADHQRAAEHRRRRAHRASQAWEAASGGDESSILTMRQHGDRSQDVADRNGRRPHGNGASPGGFEGGEQGRQG